MKIVSAISIIKRLRQRNGISQKELSGKVGLTQQAIALIESGKRKLNNIGKKETRKRVQELTEIPRYTEPDEPIKQLNAAHKRTDTEIPDGVDTSENDIMDDEDF